MDVLLKAGANCAVIDPVTIVAAMADVTKSVSFGITGSTSYIGKTFSSSGSWTRKSL